MRKHLRKPAGKMKLRIFFILAIYNITLDRNSILTRENNEILTQSLYRPKIRFSIREYIYIYDTFLNFPPFDLY